MQRSRSPASSCCTAFGRDSSNCHVSAFKIKLHLQSRTQCFEPESVLRSKDCLLVLVICTRAHAECWNNIGENHTIALAANRGSARPRSETGNQHGEVVQTFHGAASGARARRAQSGTASEIGSHLRSGQLISIIRTFRCCTV